MSLLNIYSSNVKREKDRVKYIDAITQMVNAITNDLRLVIFSDCYSSLTEISAFLSKI